MHAPSSSCAWFTLVKFTSPMRTSTFRRRAEKRARTHRRKEGICGRFSKAGRVPFAARHRLSALARQRQRVRACPNQSTPARTGETGREEVPGTRHSLFRRCPPLCTGLARVGFRTGACERQEARRARARERGINSGSGADRAALTAEAVDRALH